MKKYIALALAVLPLGSSALAEQLSKDPGTYSTEDGSHTVTVNDDGSITDTDNDSGEELTFTYDGESRAIHRGR